MIRKILKIGLWIALALGAVFGGFLVIAILEYGYEAPISDITGCYSRPLIGVNDKFCIYPSGRYAQFSTFGGEEEKKYNEGLWKSNTYIPQDLGGFDYGRDDDYQNVVLVGYVHIVENGELVKSGSINIRPHETRFGLIVAMVHDITTGERVSYTR